MQGIVGRSLQSSTHTPTSRVRQDDVVAGGGRGGLIPGQAPHSQEAQTDEKDVLVSEQELVVDR